MGQAVFVHPSNSMGSFRGICRTVCPRVNYRIAQTVVRSFFSHGGSPGRSIIDKLALDLLTLFQGRSLARSFSLDRLVTRSLTHPAGRFIHADISSSTWSLRHPLGRFFIHAGGPSSTRLLTETRAVLHPRKHFLIHASGPSSTRLLTHPHGRCFLHANISSSTRSLLHPRSLPHSLIHSAVSSSTQTANSAAFDLPFSLGISLHAFSRPHLYRLSITLDAV